MTESVGQPEVRLERDGSLATVVISNPARLNATTAAMWAALPEVLARADADPAVRVVMVRGAGAAAFSAGADISEFETSRTGEAARHYNDLNHRAFEALQAVSKPTVAMIHGHCLGGGLAIAACCDLRLADERATFAIPAARLGIGYDPRWVKPLLAILPPPRVKEILFTARRIPAMEALAMGLVNAVYPAADLERQARALAGAMSENAPLTLKAAKRAVDALAAAPGSADLAPLDRLVADCFASADYAEGQRAFLEKRKPVFEGH